jgi:hypothetical protein
VTARVVSPQALLDATLERRALRLAQRRAQSSASKLDPKDYGSIAQLRDLLGLPPPYTTHRVHANATLPQDALIVSFDTEWERHGLKDHVVEIGVTILDTRDIIDVAPGRFAYDWIAKTKTYHYVVDVTRRPSERMRTCLFGDDMFADVSAIKRDIVSVLQRAAHPPYDPSRVTGLGPRKVILVGHSVHIDLLQLFRSPGLELDLYSKDVFLTKPAMVFDTFMLTNSAALQGAGIESAKLGRLVNWLGVHPQYKHHNFVIGCHNAGNDAAYAMMALLMYALRWEQIIPGEIVPLYHEEAMRKRELHLRLYSSKLRDDASVNMEKRKMREVRLSSRDYVTSGSGQSLQVMPARNTFWQFWLQKLTARLRQT